MKLIKVKTCILLALSITWSASVLVQSLGQETRPRSSSAELELYKQWYDAFKERHLPQIIELGEGYLQSYPEGEFAAFLRQIIDFARTSLDPARLGLAQSLRSQVKRSVSGREDLESLLSEIMNQQGDVNMKSSTGQTALMLSAVHGDVQSVKVLLTKDVDLDVIESGNGWTALVYAIWGGDYFLVKYLLEYYPDAGIKDKEGRTALDHAIASGDFEMMLLIGGRGRRGSHPHSGPNK